MGLSLNRENDEKVLRLVREIAEVSGVSTDDITLTTTQQGNTVVRTVTILWHTHNTEAQVL